MKLVTEEQLAEDFGITVEKAAELRRKHQWPHLRLGRSEIRYTPDQVAAIIAMHTVRPREPEGPRGLPGQTPLSAKRSAR